MSDLLPLVTPLARGLDLKSPKLLAEPGSLISCLNYEITDVDGYKRIDGFVPYDGNVTLKDFAGAKYWRREVTVYADDNETLPLNDLFIYNEDQDIVGWCFALTGDLGTSDPIVLDFVSFLGDPNINGYLQSTSLNFYAKGDEPLEEITITNTQLQTMEAALRDLVAPNTEESVAVGLHWHRDHLYGVFPLVCIAYKCDSAVTVLPGSALNSTLTGVMNLLVLDKIVTSATTPEQGYLLCLQTSTGVFEADASDTYTLSTGVTAADTIYHQPGCLAGVTSFAAHLWKATRQNPYIDVSFGNSGGWNPLSFTYSVRATMDLVSTPDITLSALKRGSPPGEATELILSSGASTFTVVLEDYFIVSGDLYDGSTAEVILQVSPSTSSLVPFTAFLSGMDVAIASNSIGTTISLPRLVFLAGMSEDLGEVTYYETINTAGPVVRESTLRGLSFSPSRYTWKSANFFATEATDAFYGCNGAGRGFACTPYTLAGSDYAGTYSWIYTQDDEAKDRPRHVENHNQHLLLGFGPGSVQSSVIGEPTNFAGVEGANEVGVGDRVTGLLSLNGTTTAIFCEGSIWSLNGQNIDNFNTQILSPNVGAIEYTVANCGMPVFMNQYGVTTLEQTAAYGDFSTNSISQRVGPWLVPRCKLAYPNADYYEGVVGAVPIRKKNQYRIFFNDGECLTVTFTTDGAAFTRQVYQVPVGTQVDPKLQRLVPIAWTSQIDKTGRERVMVSHYDKRVEFTPPPMAA